MYLVKHCLNYSEVPAIPVNLFWSYSIIRLLRRRLKNEIPSTMSTPIILYSCAWNTQYSTGHLFAKHRKGAERYRIVSSPRT